MRKSGALSRVFLALSPTNAFKDLTFSWQAKKAIDVPMTKFASEDHRNHLSISNLSTDQQPTFSSASRNGRREIGVQCAEPLSEFAHSLCSSETPFGPAFDWRSVVRGRLEIAAQIFMNQLGPGQTESGLAGVPIAGRACTTPFG